ncbi:MATE family efflux transporter [Vibrio sp. UCD-FRSSP16_10]|uniref:MATE family efflux transporter n=1 Tax=unclassified Vibrio TaxID=2614977 RepID=UPI0007FEEC9F|nr:MULTISPECIES: MATE family efflux transporter [unclassified Vibrio]OBT08528.1 MATE family efflux transporter [Vibrio sp. UCD-FRSSP16_30]OBT18058.1 MATE family efflux transporter [Vibrio sp. UCD-FRSSP16_10]
MAQQEAKFVEGSTMKHILTMSGAGSIGLMSLFIVDLLDMMFISMLGQVELAAAVGFAGTLIFFSTSISIGTSIAMGALVSKELGAKRVPSARRLVINILVSAFLVNAVITGIMTYYIPELLQLIGAKGAAFEHAKDYMYILLPSTPIVALAMAAGAALRAAGDAKRSMMATIWGGVVNAILDPIFIFVLMWNVEGAAIASVISRFTVLAFSLTPLIRQHNLVGRFHFRQWLIGQRVIFAIAFPAICTNISTPVGNAFVTSAIAQFGEDFVAGFAVVGRLTPVVFAAIFALSGAVGPIIGQNYGAERVDRVKETLWNSLLIVSVYCVVVSLILYFLQSYIVSGFNLTGDADLLVRTFCTFVAITFLFNGMQFVANTSFNNLGKPLYSTALNVGKATVGTIPFVYIGSAWFGALGVLYGQALGNIVFGLIALCALRYHVYQLDKEALIDEEIEAEVDEGVHCVNMQPFCTHDAVAMEELVKSDELMTEKV